jgi:hypothetical protein
MPAGDPPSVPTTEPNPVESEPEPPAENIPAPQPSKPTGKSSDWRDLFAQAPGASEPALGFDSLPAAPAIPAPTAPANLAEIIDPIEDDRPETHDVPDVETTVPDPLQFAAAEPVTAEQVVAPPQLAPSRPTARAYPVPPAPEPASFDSRMARFDRGIGNRSPQEFVLLGIMILFSGCIVSVVLSAIGASDSTVGLLFICAGPLGLIVLVIGIILAVARREGRQR